MGRSIAGFSVALVWAIVLMLALPIAAAQAQSCTADIQCPDGGRSTTTCSGNAVVTQRSVCTGSCRKVEESRIPCSGQCLAGRCVGQPAAAPVGPVLPQQPWPRCALACTCRNKILIISTGVWSPERGCDQIIRRCTRGCTCDPEPRCR